MIPDYKILKAQEQGIYVFKFIGEIRLNSCITLDHIIDSLNQDEQLKTIVIDLTEATMVDSTTLGLIAKIAMLAYKRSLILPTIISTNPDVSRMLESMGFDKIALIMHQPASDIETLQEIPSLQCSEAEVREQVLEAHRVLANLDEQNRDKFKDLIQALECEQEFEHTASGL